MPTYAADTAVSTERSQLELQQTLRRYGADQFQLGWSNDMAMVAFVVRDRLVRFVLPMPDRTDKAFLLTGHNPPRRRTPKQVEEAYEQATRQRWRALNLVIKAKLEAVEAGISEFDNEFLANIVLPNGQTVGDHVGPSVRESIRESLVPPTLFPPVRALDA